MQGGRGGDGRAAFQPEIQHVIELFGVGNRSVTCSRFMLEQPVSCRSLADLPSPLSIFPPSLSLSSVGRGCGSLAGVKVASLGGETVTCVSSGVEGKAGVAAVPAQTHSLPLLRAQGT